jgi:hypothetical protein
MRRTLLTVIVVTVAASASANSLDGRLSTLRVPHTLPACGIATVVAQLARAGHVAIGFERQIECTGVNSFPKLDVTNDAIDLSGVSVRSALDQVVALAPSYRWQDVGGIAVIRPDASWADPDAPLNLPVRAFTLNDGSLSEAVAKTVNVPAHESPLDDKRFSLSFAGGTIADALIAIVRARGGVLWDAGLIAHPSPTGERANPSLMISLRTFDAGEQRSGQGGFSVGTPVARLRTLQD